MDWPEWMDAMHKLGYADSQIAHLLEERGYKKRAIKSAFGPQSSIPFFHILFLEDSDEYFSRLDISNISSPLVLLFLNFLVTGIIASFAFSKSLQTGLILSLSFMSLQILCSHAGAKQFGGIGTFRQTFFSAALPVSIEFFIASIGFVLFAFFKNFSSVLGITFLLLMLWIAIMLSGALSYSGLKQYHQLNFSHSLISAFLLPILSIIIGIVMVLITGVFAFSASL